MNLVLIWTIPKSLDLGPPRTTENWREKKTHLHFQWTCFSSRSIALHTNNPYQFEQKQMVLEWLYVMNHNGLHLQVQWCTLLQLNKVSFMELYFAIQQSFWLRICLEIDFTAPRHIELYIHLTFIIVSKHKLWVVITSGGSGGGGGHAAGAPLTLIDYVFIPFRIRMLKIIFCAPPPFQWKSWIPPDHSTNFGILLHTKT